MAWKDNFIAKHGEEAYANRLTRRKRWGEKLPGGEAQRSRERREADPEKWREYDREWRERNPGVNIEKGRKISKKGGAYYDKHMRYRQTGIPGEREKIRCRHGNKWRPYKCIIAQESQLHHEWVSGTAKYTGLALVEANQHIYGFIDVIQILEGKIRLFTEKEIKEQEIKNMRG